MDAWPALLPTLPRREGFRIEREDNRKTFKTEIGEPKRSRRTFVSSFMMSISLDMTDTQVDLFEEFWEDTLQDGVYPFTFTDPRTQETLRYTFETGYNIEDTGSFDDDEPVWRVSFTLRGKRFA